MLGEEHPDSSVYLVYSCRHYYYSFLLPSHNLTTADWLIVSLPVELTGSSALSDVKLVFHVMMLGGVDRFEGPGPGNQ